MAIDPREIIPLKNEINGGSVSSRTKEIASNNNGERGRGVTTLNSHCTQTLLGKSEIHAVR